MKSAASVMRDLNYSTTDHTSLPIAAPQTATIRAPADGPSWCGKQRSCRSELRCPSRAAISSFGFVEGFGGRLGHAPGGTIVHLTCDPKSMQAAKKKHPLEENGTLAVCFAAAMRAYDGSRLVFPR